MAKRIIYDGPGDPGVMNAVSKKAKIHVIPPGTWFHSLTLVLMIPTWLPWVAKLLGMGRLAKLASPGCGKCNSRRNAMNGVGWIGLPRLIARYGKEWVAKSKPIGYNGIDR